MKLTEIILKTYKKVITMNFFKMFLFKVLGIGVSFLSVPLFLTLLDKNRYGIWITIWSFVGWLAFFDFGLGQGMRNKLTNLIVIQDYEKAKNLVSTTYFYMSVIFLSLIFCSLIYTFNFDVSLIFNSTIDLNSEVEFSFVVITVSMLVLFILRLLDIIALSLHVPALSYELLFVTQFFNLIILLMIYYFNLNVDLVLLSFCYSFSSLFIYICYSVYYFNTKFSIVKPSIKYIKCSILNDVYKNSSLIFVIQIILLLLNQSGNLILSNTTSPSHVPEFFIVNKFFNIIPMIFLIFSSPFWAKTSELFFKGDLYSIEKDYNFLLKIALFLVFFGFILIIISSYFLPWWSNGKLEFNWTIVLLAFFYNIFFMFSNLYLTFLNGMNKFKFQFYILIIVSFVFILALFYFYDFFDTVGLLIAMCLIYLVLSFSFFMQFKLVISNQANEFGRN